jgi:hypothetical protein
MVSDGCRWLQMVSDGFRWFQMVSDGFRWYSQRNLFLYYIDPVSLALFTIYLFGDPDFIAFGTPKGQAGQADD